VCAFRGYRPTCSYNRILIENSALKVKPTGQCNQWSSKPKVTRPATKPSPAPLQKSSPGGCIIDMLPSNCHRLGVVGTYRFAARHLVPNLTIAAWTYELPRFDLGNSSDLNNSGDNTDDYQHIFLLPAVFKNADFDSCCPRPHTLRETLSLTVLKFLKYRHSTQNMLFWKRSSQSASWMVRREQNTKQEKYFESLNNRDRLLADVEENAVQEKK